MPVVGRQSPDPDRIAAWGFDTHKEAARLGDFQDLPPRFTLPFELLRHFYFFFSSETC